MGGEQPSVYRVVNHNLQPGGCVFLLGYLFAFWCGRMITIVGQVSSKDVELAGNHPPRVSHFDLVLWGQEDPELAGREGG